MAAPPRPAVHRGPMHPAAEAETRTGPVRGLPGVPASYEPGFQGARRNTRPASPCLQRASDASGKTLPARPDTAGAPTLPEQAGGNAPDSNAAPADAGAPTDTHGAAVSAVATGEDPTPDTNKGV